MAAPSAKMLDKLTAALTAVPCGGYCFVFNDADEDAEHDNFTTMTVEEGVRIFNKIPSLSIAQDMADVTNAVNRIKAKVYGRPC